MSILSWYRVQQLDSKPCRLESIVACDDLSVQIQQIIAILTNVLFSKLVKAARRCSDNRLCYSLPAVNGNLGADSICVACCFSPRSAAKPAMISREPMVKDKANFDGAMAIIGRKMEKAMIMKTRPDPMNAKKYANCCGDGILYLQDPGTT